MLIPFRRKKKLPPAVEEKVEEAEELLEIDRNYFLSEYKIIMKLLRNAERIADTIHKLASEKRNLKRLKNMVAKLKELKDQESWQQLAGRYSEVRKVMDKVLKFVEPTKRSSVELLMRKEHIFESKLLHQTVNVLELLIMGKKLHEIQWDRVKKTIEVLRNDVTALILVMEDLKKAVEKI